MTNHKVFFLPTQKRLSENDVTIHVYLFFTSSKQQTRYLLRAVGPSVNTCYLPFGSWRQQSSAIQLALHEMRVFFKKMIKLHAG